jgi:hypothetical protein
MKLNEKVKIQAILKKIWRKRHSIVVDETIFARGLSLFWKSDTILLDNRFSTTHSP